MSKTVVVNGASCRLVSNEEAKARVKAGWKLASDLPKLDQQLLRDRFAGEADWLKALEPPAVEKTRKGKGKGKDADS